MGKINLIHAMERLGWAMIKDALVNRALLKQVRLLARQLDEDNWSGSQKIGQWIVDASKLLQRQILEKRSLLTKMPNQKMNAKKAKYK